MSTITTAVPEPIEVALIRRLRDADSAQLPPPRKFSRKQMEEWIRGDEEGMRRLRAND